MRHRIVRVAGGRVAYTNTSTVPDRQLVEAIRFVARHVSMDGVVVHMKRCGKRRRTYGRAYEGIPKLANLDGLRKSDWDYLVVATDGRGIEEDEWLHTLAHEAKHIEQFREKLTTSEVAAHAFADWLRRQWLARVVAAAPHRDTASSTSTRRRHMTEPTERLPFDEAALFLLDLPKYQDLFEPTGDPFKARCKGCTAIVPLGEREHHREAHRRERKEGSMATKTSSRSSKKNGGRTRVQTPQNVIDEIKKAVRSGVGISTVGKQIQEKYPATGKWYPSRVRSTYLRATGEESIAAVREKHSLHRATRTGHSIPEDVRKRIVQAVNKGQGLSAVATSLNDDKKLGLGSWYPSRVRQVYLSETGFASMEEARGKHALKRAERPKREQRKPSGRKATTAKAVEQEEKAHRAAGGRGSTRQARPLPKKAQAAGTSRGGTGHRATAKKPSGRKVRRSSKK